MQSFPCRAWEQRVNEIEAAFRRQAERAPAPDLRTAMVWRKSTAGRAKQQSMSPL
jgi:hypothetical protein